MRVGAAPSRGAQHAAQQIEGALAAEQSALAAASSAKRAELQSAADAQAEQILASSAVEYGTTLRSITDRETAARAAFARARGDVGITRAAEVELARSDSRAAEKRLRDGSTGLGTKIKGVASSEGDRMRSAAQGAINHVQASGWNLADDMTATHINPRAIAADLDDDELPIVQAAIEEAKSSGRGAVLQSWFKTHAELMGTAVENAHTFRDAAEDISHRIDDALPKAFDSFHEGGDATAGLINAMAASQLSAIDNAEHQTMASLEHAKSDAHSIHDAGHITAADVRSKTVGQITQLNNQEAAASKGLASMADEALLAINKNGNVSYLHASHAVAATTKALKTGGAQLVASLNDAGNTAMAQVNGAATAFAGAVGGQRDKLLSSVDAAIGSAASVLTSTHNELTASCAAFRAAAVVSYVAAETQVLSKAAPEIAKAESDWKSKASEFVTSCAAYESATIAKHNEVRSGFKGQLESVATKTVAHIRRSTAKKIWDGIWDGIGRFAKGVAIFVLAVLVVALVIVAFVGTAFLGLALGIAALVVGAVMLAVGLLRALYSRFKQLWNNDWPWYAKIAGIPAAIGVAVGDVLGLSQIAEAIRGRELMSDKKLSTEERAARATEGALQLITLGLIKELTKGGEAPAGETPPGGRGGRGSGGGTETAPPPETTSAPKPGETTTATAEPPKTQTSPETTKSDPTKPTQPEPLKPEPQKTDPTTSEPPKSVEETSTQPKNEPPKKEPTKDPADKAKEPVDKEPAVSPRSPAEVAVEIVKKNGGSIKKSLAELNQQGWDQMQMVEALEAAYRATGRDTAGWARASDGSIVLKSARIGPGPVNIIRPNGVFEFGFGEMYMDMTTGEIAVKGVTGADGQPVPMPGAPASTAPAITPEPPKTTEPPKTAEPPVTTPAPKTTRPPPTTPEPPKTAEPPATTSPEPAKAPPDSTQKPADTTKVEEPPTKEAPKPAESPFKAEGIEKSKSYAKGAAKNHSDKFDFKNDPDAQGVIEKTWRDAFNEEYVKQREAGETVKNAEKQARKAADQAAKVAAVARSGEPINLERAREQARADHDADNQFKDDLNQDTKDTKDAYDAGKQGGAAKSLASKLRGKTVPEMEQILDADAAAGKCTKLPPSTTQGKPMSSWQYPDGTLVRLKPLGSDKSPNSMYSIEVTKQPGVSGTQDDVAFKVDSGGKATPKGPDDLKIPYKKDINPNQYEAYKTEAMKYGHQEAVPEPPKPAPGKK